MFLLSDLNLRLRPILLDLKPGTRIVSNTFDMGGWKPDTQSEIGHRQVFMWIVPAQVAGDWQGRSGADTLKLTLQQDFQFLTGRVQIADTSIDIREGWLHGVDIHLTLADGRKLHGRVGDNRIDPVPAAKSKDAPGWHAIRTPS
jgi:hypothetical protein